MVSEDEKLERWQLAEGQTVGVHSEDGAKYSITADEVGGAVLGVTVHRELHPDIDGRRVPAHIVNGEIAVNNPNEPVISVGRRLVITGINAATNKRAVLIIPPVETITPPSM
jgi:hypothetical protein